MNDEFNFMSESMPGLVSMLQEDGLNQFEEQHRIAREQRAAIREANNQGLNISELSSVALEEHQAKQQLQADLDKINQDAAAAAAKKEADAKQQNTQERFPAPPITV